MRKLLGVLAVAFSVAVCAFVTYLTVGSGQMTLIYNIGFLVVMLLMITAAILFGFLRMHETAKGLDRASKKLIAVYQNKAELAEITRAGAQIFGVAYLDHKYQEYLGYLRKTNSPCDIGDYIGEYEINNYTHRRLVEMVPDMLTSLGILGTFLGLVWGLKGFNPVSYEAMATSITSLIDGIKVAFVTSIYGISLSLAYSYCERGALTRVAESLDNFLDKYYLCAVSPTDATAMKHVLSNQKAQVKALENMGENISGQIAVSLADHMDPVMMQMNTTLEHFTDVVTANQQEMMDKVAEKMMSAMRKEFVSEFAQMKQVLKESGQMQAAVNRQMDEALKERESWQKDLGAQLADQRQYQAEYASYMSQAMETMSNAAKQQEKMVKALTRQVEQMEASARQSIESARLAAASAKAADEAAYQAERPVSRTQIDDLEELTDRLDRVIELMEKQQRMQKNAKRGLFR